MAFCEPSASVIIEDIINIMILYYAKRLPGMLNFPISSSLFRIGIL